MFVKVTTKALCECWNLLVEWEKHAEIRTMDAREHFMVLIQRKLIVNQLEDNLWEFVTWSAKTTATHTYIHIYTWIICLLCQTFENYAVAAYVASTQLCDRTFGDTPTKAYNMKRKIYIRVNKWNLNLIYQLLGSFKFRSNESGSE